MLLLPGTSRYASCYLPLVLFFLPHCLSSHLLFASSSPQRSFSLSFLRALLHLVCTSALTPTSSLSPAWEGRRACAHASHHTYLHTFMPYPLAHPLSWQEGTAGEKEGGRHISLLMPVSLGQERARLLRSHAGRRRHNARITSLPLLFVGRPHSLTHLRCAIARAHLRAFSATPHHALTHPLSSEGKREGKACLPPLFCTHAEEGRKEEEGGADCTPLIFLQHFCCLHTASLATHCISGKKKKEKEEKEGRRRKEKEEGRRAGPGQGILPHAYLHTYASLFGQAYVWPSRFACALLLHVTTARCTLPASSLLIAPPLQAGTCPARSSFLLLHAPLTSSLSPLTSFPLPTHYLASFFLTHPLPRASGRSLSPLTLPAHLALSSFPHCLFSPLLSFLPLLRAGRGRHPGEGCLHFLLHACLWEKGGRAGRQASFASASTSPHLTASARAHLCLSPLLPHICLHCCTSSLPRLDGKKRQGTFLTHTSLLSGQWPSLLPVLFGRQAKHCKFGGRLSSGRHCICQHASSLTPLLSHLTAGKGRRRAGGTGQARLPCPPLCFAALHVYLALPLSCCTPALSFALLLTPHTSLSFTLCLAVSSRLLNSCLPASSRHLLSSL